MNASDRRQAVHLDPRSDVDRVIWTSAAFALLHDADRCRVLTALLATPHGCTLGDIVRGTRLTKAAAAGVLQDLERQGLVTARRTPRVVRYRMTPGTAAAAIKRVLAAQGLP